MYYDPYGINKETIECLVGFLFILFPFLDKRYISTPLLCRLKALTGFRKNRTNRHKISKSYGGFEFEAALNPMSNRATA